MKTTIFARLGGAVALTLSLAACMDVSMSIDVLSETEAQATMVTAMSPDMYAMVQAQAADGEDEFCPEGETVETATAVECVITERGLFGELNLESEDGGPTIEAIGNGRVRVSFPTGELAAAVSAESGAEQDPQMMAMMTQMFDGHFITLSVTGGEIVETNMERAEDGVTARHQIPFAALMTGDLDLPEELFAVVQK